MVDLSPAVDGVTYVWVDAARAALVAVAVALPALWFVARRSLQRASKARLALQLCLRALALAGLAAALGQPARYTPQHAQTVVIAMDDSASVDAKGRARAEAATQRLRAAVDRHNAELQPRDHTRLHVLRYGETITRVADTEAAAPGKSGAAADLDSAHTRALRVAHTLIGPERPGKVLFLSDGRAQAPEARQLQALAAELTERKLAVGHVPVATSSNDDLAIASVQIPPHVRVGQTFDMELEVRSTVDTEPVEVEVDIEVGGEPNAMAPTRTLHLERGVGRARVPVRVNKPGALWVRASLRAPDANVNMHRENDSGVAAAPAYGRPDVLLVGRDPTHALARALRADHLAVHELAGARVPQSASELDRYDLVVFSNVAAATLPDAAHQAIERHVRDGGAGLLMVGGDRGFGLGGWRASPLARLLPVTFEGREERRRPVLALVLVIDKSGSMGSEHKLELVKEAARATARTLDAHDQIGVIAFESHAQTLVRLQPARNRIRIGSDIGRLSAGGGTNVLPALREAYLQLAGSRAMIKHVIVLSDGQSPDRGVMSLVSDMRDADITVSSVGVGAGAGKDLLRRVASEGLGRYYFSQDGTDVPQIFSRETRELTKNAAQERLLMPRVAKQAQVVRGLDWSRAPGLRGAVPLIARPLAETLLRTHDGDPLLVRGRAGLGKTAAFASDAEPRWAANWIEWHGFAKFWAQLARDTMRVGRNDFGGASLEVLPTADADRFEVGVDLVGAEQFIDGARVTVELSRADVESDPQVLELTGVAPGRYVAPLPDFEAAPYLLRARAQNPADGRDIARTAVGWVPPRPGELDPWRQVAAMDGLAQVSLESDAEADAYVRAPTSLRLAPHREPLWPWVLAFWVLPCLLLDLAARRVPTRTRRPATT